MIVAVARPKGESERSGSPFAWRGGRALPCGTSGPQLRLPAEITYISGQHLPYGRKCVRKCTLFSAAGGFEVGCVSQRDVPRRLIRAPVAKSCAHGRFRVVKWPHAYRRRTGPLVRTRPSRRRVPRRFQRPLFLSISVAHMTRSPESALGRGGSCARLRVGSGLDKGAFHVGKTSDDHRLLLRRDRRGRLHATACVDR